jgi:hypothetical protein
MNILKLERIMSLEQRRLKYSLFKKEYTLTLALEAGMGKVSEVVGVQRKFCIFVYANAKIITENLNKEI